MRTTTGSIFSGVVGRSAHARAARAIEARTVCAKRFAAIYLSEQGALMSTADTASLPSWVDDQCTTAMGYLSSDAASSSSDFGVVDDEEGMSFSAMCAAEEALAGARAADALNAAVVAAARKAADPLTKRKLSRKARLPTALSPVRPAREPPSLGTASALRSEVQMVRSTCKHADLVMERAERVHDEVAQIYEASGGLPLEDCLSCAEACELHARFEAALRELESVDIEDALPPAVGFAEPSILVELSATRESLQVAILQTRTAMEQMQAIAESGADEDDEVGSPDAVDSSSEQLYHVDAPVLSISERLLLRQMENLLRVTSPCTAGDDRRAMPSTAVRRNET